ncbi:VOC family protein [Actinoplanes sp. NPDC051513]
MVCWTLHEAARDEGVPDHVVMADPEGNEFCVV